VDSMPARTLRFQLGSPRPARRQRTRAREVRPALPTRFHLLFVRIAPRCSSACRASSRPGSASSGRTEPGPGGAGRNLYREIDNCDVLYLFQRGRAISGCRRKSTALARKASQDDNPRTSARAIEGPPIPVRPKPSRPCTSTTLQAQIVMASAS
jgi:hypothetical protein